MDSSSNVVLAKGRQVSKVAPQGFDPILWNQLSVVGHTHTVSQKTVVAEEGALLEGIWIVVSGLLALHKGTSVVDFAEPGEAVGGALVSQRTDVITMPITLQTVKKTELLFVPLEHFKRLLIQSDRLRDYIQLNFQKRMFFVQAIRASANKPVSTRLANLLLQKEHLLSRNRITRRVLAQVIGTSTESVMRILSSWHKEGLIDESNGPIIIVNRPRLEALCLALTD